jgi:large subunit ribosomal protein L21
MYAVIKAGGKQHKVQPGDVIEIELMHRGHDEAIAFTPLLVVDDDGKTHFGKELVKAQVKGKLVGQEKGDKVKVFKYRPKTGYARRQGHRQMHTLVEIQEIVLGKRAPAKKAEQPKEPVAEEAPASEGAASEEAASEEAPAAESVPEAEGRLIP